MNEGDIPHGPYCYKFLYVIPGMIGYRVSLCPYWKEENGVGFCEYLNDREDICIDDQVKICGINEEYE